MEMTFEMQKKIFTEDWYKNRSTEQIEYWYRGNLDLLEKVKAKGDQKRVEVLSFFIDIMGSVLVKRMNLTKDEVLNTISETIEKPNAPLIESKSLVHDLYKYKLVVMGNDHFQEYMNEDLEVLKEKASSFKSVKFQLFESSHSNYYFDSHKKEHHVYVVWQKINLTNPNEEEVQKNESIF